MRPSFEVPGYPSSWVLKFLSVSKLGPDSRKVPVLPENYHGGTQLLRKIFFYFSFSGGPSLITRALRHCRADAGPAHGWTATGRVLIMRAAYCIAAIGVLTVAGAAEKTRDWQAGTVLDLQQTSQYN